MSSRPPMDQGNYRGQMPQQQPESTSVMDQYSNFDGTYNSARDLRVEGQVKGTIVCKGSLHIAQGANVKATVEAESISVAGELDGEITCRGRLELLQTGRVKGHITTQSLVIHEGAVYEGEMEMGGNSARSRRNRSVDRTETGATPETASASSTAPAAADVSTSEEVGETPSTETETPQRPSSFIRRFGTQDSSSTPTAPEANDK